MWRPTKWTMKKAKALTHQELQRMTTEELADLGQYYYLQFHRRLNEGLREGILPYGIRKMYKDFEYAKTEMIDTPQGPTPLNELIGYDLDVPVTRKRGEYVELSETYLRQNRPRNSLLSYVYSMREFFTWKTSTVAGWKRAVRQQDINLFGKDEFGNPLRTMNEAERLRFWDLYEELKKQGKVDVYADGRFNEGFLTTWNDVMDNSESLVDTTELVKRFEDKLGRDIAFPEFPVGDPSNPIAQVFDPDDIWAGDFWGRKG